jgi:hypothetical protein
MIDFNTQPLGIQVGEIIFQEKLNGVCHEISRHYEDLIIPKMSAEH